MKNRALSVTFTRDSKPQFIDQSTARNPTSPLVPFMVATKHCSPEFDFHAVDVVCCRNTVRKLLRWTGGIADRDIRIDVEVVGETRLMVRWEPRVKEGATPKSFVDGMTRAPDAAGVRSLRDTTESSPT